MDEDLLGYLLNALGPEEHLQVAAYLEAHPEARARLESLKEGLAPLAEDREEVEPPPGLAARTLACLPGGPCADLPRAPRTRGQASGRPTWHRADVLVAASLLILALGVGVTWLVRVRSAHDVVACQNNLREFFTALKTYSEQHRGNFPDVANAARPPRNVAGLVVPILKSEGELPPDASLLPRLRRPVPPSLTLEQMLQMNDEEFSQQVVRLGYAYSLGYRDEAGQYHGPRFEPTQPCTQIPLMSDCPPVDLCRVNSLNHEGRGQNVLYMDGHVRFCTHRGVGVAGDDIFLNRANQVAAGLDPLDAVLGRGTAHP